MCGVMAYWSREALLERWQYDTLLRGASLRGNDGIGVGILSDKLQYISQKSIGSYDERRESTLNFIERWMEVGSILLVNCRATPETEQMTTIEMLQPIKNRNKILVHNGGVVDSIRKKFPKYEYTTNIDSETILAAYEKFGNNMKLAMEYLVGSFAFIMVDMNKKKLYAVNSFNPLCHMYIRGYGYFLHSDNDVLSSVLEDITGQTEDGVNVWEAWYHHYLQSYSIIETDLESGFQFKQQFTPRFFHPAWDSLKKGERKKTLVVASGGIDSGLTAHILKAVGRDVELVHFQYGQKSEECEMSAVNLQAKKLGVSVRVIDLKTFYSNVNEMGMLTSKEIGINSGGEFIKSTIAWTSGRNAVFASMTMALAESLITQGLCDYVDISAGWAQLSEETGGYPDNSFQFNQALEQLKMVGYITGSRINFLPIMQRITKTEEWVLGGALTFPFNITVSCDEPKMVGGIPHLCVGCGSTKLSILASDRAGVKDDRYFLTQRPILSKKMKSTPVEEIINRLILTDKEKKVLQNML